MKKLVNSIIFMTLLSSMFYACVKQQKTPEQPISIYDNNVTVFYQRGSPAVVVSNSIFADHTTKIERVGYFNESLSNLRSNLQWKEVMTNYKLVLNEINRYSFDNSRIQIIEVKLGGTFSFQSIIVYSYAGRYIFAKAISQPLAGNFLKFDVEDLDGRVYYGFETNAEGKIGRFHTFNQIPFRKVILNNENIIQNNIPTLTCYQQYPNNFNACMDCAVQECANDWLCSVACVSGGTSTALGCIAVFALSCSGIAN